LEATLNARRRDATGNDSCDVDGLGAGFRSWDKAAAEGDAGSTKILGFGLSVNVMEFWVCGQISIEMNMY
jgi:hypothetical protein